MDIHFECTQCGRCCHGLRLTLCVDEAIAWARNGDTVQILTEALPWSEDDADANSHGEYEKGRSVPATSGEAMIRITGIRSDLPGLVTAQVTQNIYDSPTGRILLIPQGARLIGDYDADVAFGQNRILLAWNRLILPDGRSIVLERQPASDPRGFAGLQDGTDYHWGGVLKAAFVSTLLGAGAELGSGDDGNLARAFRRGTQDSINRAGEQIVSRELNVRPTLTIRPGFPMQVLVTRDIVLGGGQ